jgi:hypothetical protein
LAATSCGEGSQPYRNGSIAATAGGHISIARKPVRLGKLA